MDLGCDGDDDDTAAVALCLRNEATSVCFVRLDRRRICAGSIRLLLGFFVFAVVLLLLFVVVIVVVALVAVVVSSTGEGSCVSGGTALFLLLLLLLLFPSSSCVSLHMSILNYSIRRQY